MAITYDTAMQVYFGMYAVTMSTFPDEYVPEVFRPSRIARFGKSQLRVFPESRRASTNASPP
jgi:hypothetical protein|tara:strand:- start:965 stop:1150 length:186 start_codon:yes stop_codon:yes gene_type:complete